MKVRNISAALGAAALSLVISAGPAEAVKELRVATAAPQQTPWGKWFDSVAKKVGEASGGKLKLNTFYSSQLGDEQSVIRQVVRGRIDIAGQSNTATSLVLPEFALLAAPYLWDSPEHADCVFDKYVGDIYGPMLNEAGLVLLTYVEVGHMITFTRKPVRVPADLKGYKIRVAPTKASVLFFREAGANAVPLGTLDAMPSLKTGNVNGATWPTVYGIAIGTHKLAPNVTLTRHSHQVGTLAMSKKVWDKLSAEEQGWIMEGANLVGFLRTGIRKAEGGLVAKIEKAGVPVYRPTEAETKLWRALGPPAQKKLVEEIGGRASEIWPKIQAAVKACRS